MKITTICAIHDDINSYLRWIKDLDSLASKKNIVFQHILISSKEKLPKLIHNVSFFKVDEKSFWAKSIKFGLNQISKNHDIDNILIFNHDSIPSLEGINEAINSIETHDLVSGTIYNKTTNENIFGMIKETGFLKFKVLDNHDPIEKAVCAHGNFLLFCFKIYNQISYIPNFSHTFLDFYISSWFIKNKKKVSKTILPVGFTNESLQYRLEKLKKDTGIFKASRSNLKDVFTFYKFYKNLSVACGLVIYHLSKELISRFKN